MKTITLKETGDNQEFGEFLLCSKKNRDRTRTCPFVCSHIHKAYPFTGCIFSLLSFISGHEHIQAHMHTLNQPDAREY